MTESTAFIMISIGLFFFFFAVTLFDLAFSREESSHHQEKNPKNRRKIYGYLLVAFFAILLICLYFECYLSLSPRGFVKLFAEVSL